MLWKAKSCTQTLAVIFILLFATGCGAVNVTAKVDTAYELTRVEIRLTDEYGKPLQTVTSGKLEKDSKWSENIEAKRGQRIEAIFEFPNHATTKKTDVVPYKASKKWTWNVSVPKITEYDAKTAQDQIKELAIQLRGKSKEDVAIRLSDVQRLFGALIIVPPDKTLTGDNVQYLNTLDSIQIYKIDDLDKAAGLTASGTTEIKRDTSVNANLNIAVFGTVGASMTTNSLYRVQWSLKHDHLLQTQSMGTALANLDSNSEAMKTLEFFANLHPNASVWVLTEVSLIRSGALSLVEGQSTQVIADVTSAICTSDAAYKFSTDRQQLFGVNDYVVGWTARLFAQNVLELYKVLQGNTAKGAADEIDPSFLGKNTTAAFFFEPNDTPMVAEKQDK